MDYVVGSVAALVTGNVTPNRPRLIKRALTPTKHQPSPNVTPKSELVEDRSIFLSPSMQKKKAIVKKSPKRIFQNPDLETTDNGDGNSSLSSPKADKVKKHLKDDLDSNTGDKDPKSPKNKNKNKKENNIAPDIDSSNISDPTPNESTPKKKKKKNSSVVDDLEKSIIEHSESVTTENSTIDNKSPKKMKQRRKSIVGDESNKETDNNEVINEPLASNNVRKSPKKQKNEPNNTENTETDDKKVATETTNNQNPKKKNKKRKKKSKAQNPQEKSESTENIAEETNKENVENKQGSPKKKNRKRKKSKSQQNAPEAVETDQISDKNDDDADEKPSKKSKTAVNPNAITDKESDSEHESDNEIESENEEINKKVFESQPTADESSDEEEETKKEKPQKQKAEKQKEVSKEKSEVNTEDEIKRTLFVGNVPFSVKCKKEIKKIFNKHGQIETIRIRTVPVKDGRYTPKLAVIKNELHPERTTVNVYIKYADEASVEKALSENNTVLNENHLRVSRSSHTGAEHDPKCSIFVGNLPFAMEDELLRQKFDKCGEIESVRIIRDKKTNAGKGFGYVNFASKDGVELALALTEEDLTIKNRIIRVKRCTQLTNKQKQTKDQGGKKPFVQRQNQGNQRMQSGQRGNQGFQRNHSGQRGNQGGQRSNQGGQRGNQGGQRRNQGGQRQGNMDEEGRDGAFRRIMHKRKNQDGSGVEGPPNKKQKNINQPNKEKKSRKEFVGMTAEKKKKRKFDKGQKKKKALSEILTK